MARIGSSATLVPEESSIGTAARSVPPGRKCGVRGGDLRISDLTHNERVKLRATFLNNLGIAAFIACFITPGFFAFADTRIERLIMVLIGLIFCGVLHVLATNKLNGLR